MKDTGALVVMILYFVLTIGIAIVVGRKKTENNADYTVGGRKFGGIVLFFTMLATIVGASSVMGYTEWFYKRGVTQIWYILGICVTYLIYVFYLGPKINDFGREKGGETVGDWMEYRFGKPAKYISSALIIIAYIAITAFQYMAMATILNFVTGIDYNISLIITAVIVIFYTSLGGLWAVASTDVLQGFMTLAGVALMTPFIVNNAGGLGAIFSNAPALHLQLFGYVDPVGALSAMLVFGLGIISWPDIWQRCYAAKSKRILKKSFLLFLLASLLLSALVMLLGFSAIGLYPEFSGASNTLLPQMIMDQIPNLFGAVLLSSLLAVIMGTADSTLLVSSVMLEKDIIKPFIKKEMSEKKQLMLSKIVTAVCGVAVLGVLMFGAEMFDLWVMSADITGATLAVPILFGMSRWKRGGSAAALAAIIAGGIGWALCYAGVIAFDAILVGAALSLLAYLAVAFALPPKTDVEKANA